MRAFVFPGQGGGVVEPAAELLPQVRRVVGERIPDQVKMFARAAWDADESRDLEVRPDVVAGHSLGEYGAAYAAGCFDFETGLWLVAERDRFLRSEEHTSELQSRQYLVCRLLLEKKKQQKEGSRRFIPLV